jgi:hypothetical protein
MYEYQAQVDHYLKDIKKPGDKGKKARKGFTALINQISNDARLDPISRGELRQKIRKAMGKK